MLGCISVSLCVSTPEHSKVESQPQRWNNSLPQLNHAESVCLWFKGRRSRRSRCKTSGAKFVATAIMMGTGIDTKIKRHQHQMKVQVRKTLINWACQFPDTAMPAGALSICLHSFCKKIVVILPTLQQMSAKHRWVIVLSLVDDNTGRPGLLKRLKKLKRKLN